jgi:hypothetical protein
MTDISLKDIADKRIVHRPIIIVEALEGEQQQYFLCLEELDSMLNEPRLFGIMVSDLIDHIAGAYHQVSGRDVRDIRRDIVKTLRDEDRFKENDPSRVQNHGVITTPRGN